MLPARATAADVLLAVVVAAVMLVGSFGAQRVWVPPMRALDALGWVLIGLVAVAVLVRRVQPVAALALATAATATYLAFSYPFGPVFLGFAVCVYTVASRLPVRRSAPAGIAAAVALLVGHGVGSGGSGLVGELPLWLAWGSGWALTPWAVGTAVRTYRESHARTVAEQARRRTDEERLLIAQEMHDIVGHGLSMMSMQAAIALHVFDRRPEQARSALETIRHTSQESLDELRATLAVFRGAPQDAAPRAPVPGLDQIDALVERTARSGLPVELRTTGTRVALPSSVDLAAYRIVQEALTNVVRHAGASSATVRIDYGTGALELAIVDNGTAGDSDATDGHGIAGMRTRATAVGGALHAGPEPGGGFRVHARLPLRGPQ